MHTEDLKTILAILIKPSITIKDLVILTRQSYEKSRRDFNNIKKEYIDNYLQTSKKLPNAREIPLNDYTLHILDEWYGLNMKKIINNIKQLEHLNIE